MVLAGYEQRAQTELALEAGRDVQFTPFLGVLLYALKHSHLLRFCANPTCKEPFFVARRGSQIYCGSECAKPAQKEAKLKWWNEYGAERRQRQLGKKRGKNAKAT